jgi:hypothetical protein
MGYPWAIFDRPATYTSLRLNAIGSAKGTFIRRLFVIRQQESVEDESLPFLG